MSPGVLGAEWGVGWGGTRSEVLRAAGLGEWLEVAVVREGPRAVPQF